MKEPVFNPGGVAALVVIVGTLAICFWWGALLKAVMNSGSWLVLGLMFLAPLALGYFVGDARDRADYHRIFNWVARKFGSR